MKFTEWLERLENLCKINNLPIRLEQSFLFFFFITKIPAITVFNLMKSVNGDIGLTYDKDPGHDERLAIKQGARIIKTLFLPGDVQKKGATGVVVGGRWMDEKLQIYFIKFDNMPEVINGVAGTSIKEIK